MENVKDRKDRKIVLIVIKMCGLVVKNDENQGKPFKHKDEFNGRVAKRAICVAPKLYKIEMADGTTIGKVEGISRNIKMSYQDY